MKLNVIFTINLVLVCLWFTWREMRIRIRKGLVQVIQLLSTPLGIKTQSLYKTHFPPFCPLSSITWSMNLSGTQFPFIDMPQFSSVAQSCPTLCDPMNRTPGLPVHQQLPEFTQSHVHWIGDAIQPSHPLLPSPPFIFHLQCRGRGFNPWSRS